MPRSSRRTGLRLVHALAADAFAHSLQPGTAGSLRVQFEAAGDRLRLVVEDDGWAPRTARTWQAEIRPVQAAVERAGGRLYREVFWATNRIIAELPIPAPA